MAGSECCNVKSTVVQFKASNSSAVLVLPVKRKIHHFFLAKIRWDWTSCCVWDHRHAPRDRSVRGYFAAEPATTSNCHMLSCSFMHKVLGVIMSMCVCVVSVCVHMWVFCVSGFLVWLLVCIYAVKRSCAVHAYVLHMHCVKESSSFHRLKLQELCKHCNDWQQPQPPLFFLLFWCQMLQHTQCCLLKYFCVCMQATLPAKLLYVGLC